MITKEQFEELAGIKLVEKDGNLYFTCNLDLENRTDITELPDNLKVLGSLNLHGSGVTKLPKGLEVEYWMSISLTEIEELPEDTKIGRSLFINEMKKPFFFPKVVKVNGHFDCTRTTIKRMPEELYVKDKCDFSHSTFDNLPNVMEIRSSLDLDSTPITELPEGLKLIYDSLDMCNTKVTKLPDNLVVYGGLRLDNTPINELPEGLVVDYNLFLSNVNLKDYSNLHKVCTNFIVTEEKYEEIKDTLAKHIKKERWFNNEFLITFEPNYKGAYLFENKNGKYINADGLLGEIVEQKGNVYHIRFGIIEDIIYLVTDGEGKWAHGRTLEDAKADLIYKVSNKNKDDYKNLTLESELSFEDAIVCYRVITGACSFGTKDFVEHKLGENRKNKYTVKEIIELTECEYGNTTFKNFFCKD